MVLRAREALAEGGGGHLADLGPVAVCHAHTVAEDVGETHLPREAQKHPVGAGDPHLGAELLVLRLALDVVGDRPQAGVYGGGEGVRAPHRRLHEALPGP